MAGLGAVLVVVAVAVVGHGRWWIRLRTSMTRMTRCLRRRRRGRLSRGRVSCRALLHGSKAAPGRSCVGRMIGRAAHQPEGRLTASWAYPLHA